MSSPRGEVSYHAVHDFLLDLDGFGCEHDLEAITHKALPRPCLPPLAAAAMLIHRRSLSLQIHRPSLAHTIVELYHRILAADRRFLLPA